MKIVFSGAPGIGKTTLATAFAETQSLPLIKEGFKEIVSSLDQLHKAKIQRDRRLAKEKCRKALLAKLEDWNEKTRSLKDFVSDRSPLDVLYDWNSLYLNANYTEFMHILDYCASLVAEVDLFILPPFPRVSLEMANEDKLARRKSGEEQFLIHAGYVGVHQLVVPERTINIPLELMAIDHRMGFVRKQIVEKLGHSTLAHD